MNGMLSREIYSGYNSDQGFTFTIEVNFAPQFAVVQATFNGVNGGGLHHTGVVGFRFRPDPNGPEQSVNNGDWPTWPACVYVDHASSFTFGSAIGAEQETHILINVFFW